MAFDPDQFLAEREQAQSFDPDQFLAERDPSLTLGETVRAAGQGIAEAAMSVGQGIKRRAQVLADSGGAPVAVQEARRSNLALADRVINDPSLVSDALWSVSDTVVPPALRAGFTTAGAVVGTAATPGAGTAVGAAAGFGLGDNLAQQYELARGLRQSYSLKEQYKGMAQTGVGFAAPAAGPASTAVGNVIKQGARTGAIFGVAEGAGQLAVGERDLGQLGTSTALGVALGVIGGAVQNSQITSAQRAQVIDYARQFGFKGKSWSDLRQWWQTKRVDLARPVEPAGATPPPAAPAAPAQIPAANRPAPPPPAPPAPPPPPAPVAPAAPTLTPAAPAAQLPAPKGTRPTVIASSDSRGIAAPGVTGEDANLPTAPAVVNPPAESTPPPEPPPAIRWAYSFDGKRTKLAEGQAPANNQVTAEQWAELAPMRKSNPAQFKKLWQRTTKQNQKLAKLEAQAERNPAQLRKRLGFGPRPDGVVDIIDAIQELGGVPRPPQDDRGGEFDGWEEVFRGPARLLVSKSTGKWDQFIEDLTATYPQFAHLNGASVGAIEADIAAALAGRDRAKAAMQQEKATETFMKAALTGQGRAPKEPRAEKDPISTDEINAGDRMTIKGQDFVATEIDEAGNVVLQDGPRFGTQVVPPSTPLYPDKGSLQKAPVDAMDDWPEPEPVAAPAPVPPAPAAPAGGELFNTADTFNLASESQVAPRAPNYQADEAELFARGETRSTAPTKLDQANAATREKRGGGGGSAAGDPLPAAGMPPIPPGVPSANLNDGRMPVAMEPILKGTVDAPTVLAALQDVARAVGMETAFRSGRFYAKARGIAKSWEEVIRLNAINNLPTAAHEIAHIISKRLFGSMKSKPLMATIGDKAVIKELTALGKALYGSTKPYAGYTAEGFSELVRLWLSTDDAARIVPKANAWFETKLLRSNPELQQAMTRARQLYDLWRGQGAERRILAQTKAEPGRIRRVVEWGKQNLNGQAVVEEFSPLEQLSHAYAAVTGKRLPADRDPYLLATALRSVAGARLETWVTRGMTDLAGNITGPSLREAVAPIKPRHAEQFELYLTALQAIERFKQGKNPGIDRLDAIYVRDKLQREHPEFVTAAEAVANWWEGVLDYKVAAYPAMNGPIAARVRAKNPRYYGPLARVLDPETVRRQAAEGTGGGLHAFKGSGRPIKRMVLQSLRVAEGIIASAHRDAILRSVVQLSKTEGMGWVVEQVPRSRVMEQVSLSKIQRELEEMGVDTSDLDPDTLLTYASQRSTPAGVDPIISVTENGTIKWYQVPAQVFEILAGVQEPNRLGPLFELFMGMPNRAFKLGTTGIRASFSLITNPLRDLPTYMLQSITGNPASRAAAYFSALRDIVRAGLGGKESELLQLVDNLGLQSSTFIGGDIEQTRREARALFHGKWFRRVRSPVETLREILSFTETAPRAAEMGNILRETGWKPGQPLTLEQAIMAMVAFKRVTTDFTAKGRGWRPLYRSVPYMGAATQGLRSFARAFKSDQGTKQRSKAALRVLLNGLTMLTLPAIWNWWQNKDEDWYRNLPWRERYLYLNIPQGNQVYQIPLAPDWASAFITLPVGLLDAWYQDDPTSAKAALEHIFSVTQPLDYPVLLGAAKEQWQNRIDFFDRPIVPRGELELMPGMQRSEYTSQLAKELGDIFPGQISPRRVDAAMRQVFGGVGGDLVTAPDTFMRLLGLKTQDPVRDWEPADVPIAGRLARRGGKYSALSQPMIDYWDDYQRYSRWEQTNTRDLNAGRPPSYPMTPAQRGYAARLQAMNPFIKLRLEIAARTPELEARQKIYQQTSARLREILKTRPKD